MAGGGISKAEASSSLRVTANDAVPGGVQVPPSARNLRAARAALGDRPLVLVGLMGAGKTTVGRQIAQFMALSFTDADEEIEAVSRMSVADLFAEYGEDEFRALERRVIERLARSGPGVLATGGGAFMDERTRTLLNAETRTVWLRAELDVLVERTARKKTRPLLRTGDPKAILGRLMRERYPVYAEAHATVEATQTRREVVASRVVAALAALKEPA